MKKLYEDYIFLVRTALEGSRADDFGGDFEALLGIAREHNMTNICGMPCVKQKCSHAYRNGAAEQPQYAAVQVRQSEDDARRA